MLKLGTIKDNDWQSLRQAMQKITRELGSLSQPTFDSLTMTGLTASRLLSTDSNKAFASTDLNSWVTGTANQITVTDDSDGTITLSLPATINITTAVQINGTQVLGTQQAHIADATTQDIAGADTVDETKLESDLSGIVSTVNSILTALEAHGIVASS